ncbi:hypothetical protein BH23PAT2_BH23PAT2_08190 [soil metagenome]
MKKLQNSFNDFLPKKYFEFRRNAHLLNSNQAVVHELLRICCEEDDVKAIQMAFERILGKPEKVVVIKRTLVRTVFPEARTKALKPVVDDRVMDEFMPQTITETAVVVDEDNAPGILLTKMVDKIGEKEREYSYQVLDKKDKHTVAEVMAANLYGIAMRGSNLGAIKMLFDYLDGAVADVVRLEGEDTIELESWADVAPFEAKQGEDGVFYVETQGVR